ncbi:MAG TPA: DUF3750 domain-containing protein [Kofleriaceae bacterium]|jgi:hypothetical protein|nr:DUF3750 domain-containing protein [Kofleriaceae bacterium]
MRLAVLVIGIAAMGCIVAKRSLEMPSNEQTVVALFSGGLPHPMDGIARHPWFAVRKRGESQWRVYEVGGGGSLDDPSKNAPYVDPILHGLWTGERGDAAAACVERVGPEVKRRIEGDYVFYPGPNSNTFGDVVLRRCKLAASLPSTSVGKDWRGLVGAGVTSERTGVQLETPVLGLKVGLKEGVEVHVIGLSIGIDLWPPAIILPLGPGRLGFADR